MGKLASAEAAPIGCSCQTPLHRHTHPILGGSAAWGIGCTCFAF
jgi:hypothetical protein